MKLGEAVRFIRRLPPHIPVIIKGSPGIGKSAIGKQLADYFNAWLEVVDLNAHLPEDLAGYPKPDNGYVRRVAEEWMYNLSVEKIGSKNGVFLMDDISQVGPSMQAAVFRILHERKAGGTKLGPNVRTIVTANRRSDKAGAGTLLSPVVNRCWTITIDPDLETWLEWAREHNIDSRVRGYLRFKEESLSRLPNAADPEGRFASPRTWHLLSDSLGQNTDWEIAPEEIFDLSEGFVGDGPAVEFAAFCRHYSSLPDPREALLHPAEVMKISDPDRLIAVLTSLADEAMRLDATEYKMDKKAELLIGAVAVIAGRDNAEYCVGAIKHAGDNGLSKNSIAHALGTVKKAKWLATTLVSAMEV